MFSGMLTMVSHCEVREQDYAPAEQVRRHQAP
jgi:hypothetical protein